MIKFDNFVVIMTKDDSTGEMIPNAVVRFLTGEEGKEKRFEHVLSDEESVLLFERLKSEVDDLIKLGVKELVKDFEGNIESLQEDIS